MSGQVVCGSERYFVGDEVTVEYIEIIFQLRLCVTINLNQNSMFLNRPRIFRVFEKFRGFTLQTRGVTY